MMLKKRDIAMLNNVLIGTLLFSITYKRIKIVHANTKRYTHHTLVNFVTYLYPEGGFVNCGGIVVLVLTVSMVLFILSVYAFKIPWAIHLVGNNMH